MRSRCSFVIEAKPRFDFGLCSMAQLAFLRVRFFAATALALRAGLRRLVDFAGSARRRSSPRSVPMLRFNASIRLMTFEGCGAFGVWIGLPVCFDFTSAMTAFS